MAVMGSPHGSVVWQNKLTMFGAHCPFNPLVQLAESKVRSIVFYFVFALAPVVTQVVGVEITLASVIIWAV